jgi:hypothetical protein
MTSTRRTWRWKRWRTHPSRRAGPLQDTRNNYFSRPVSVPIGSREVGRCGGGVAHKSPQDETDGRSWTLRTVRAKAAPKNKVRPLSWSYESRGPWWCNLRSLSLRRRHQLHLVPVIRKFFSAIQAHHIRARYLHRFSMRARFDGHRKRGSPVGTTEKSIDQL